MNKLKKIAYIGMLSLLPLLGNGQDNQKIKTIEPKYNTIEAAVTGKGDVRTRAINNFNINLGNFQSWYHGLNEVDNLDKKTYFGRNWLALGTKKDKAMIDTRSVYGAPFFDVKYGVTTSRLNELTNTYGFTNITANKKNIEVFVFMGKELGNWTLESLADLQFNKENAKLYLENQVYRDISDDGKLKAFLRTESYNNFKQNKIMVGINYVF
jgi:hypothetical protein